MTRTGRNMKPVLAGIAGAVLVVGLAVAAGCASLATPQAPSTSSPSASSSSGPVQVSQQVKDGAQLYVDLACIRCHAPDGVGGIPNRLNVGGDSTIPPLNNAYRDPSEQFKNPLAITQVIRIASNLAPYSSIYGPLDDLRGVRAVQGNASPRATIGSVAANPFGSI